MSWQIQIPYRSSTDTLADVSANARHLTSSEDRAVLHEVVLCAAKVGVENAGRLADVIESMTGAERREFLDGARARAGLRSIAEIERQREQEKAASEPITNSRLQACHAPRCTTFPTTSSGALREVDVWRWFCPEHLHLAEPGDMEPPKPRVRLSPSGGFIEIDPEEEAREAARLESRRRQQENQLAARAVAIAEREALEVARADRSARETRALRLGGQ